MPYHYGPTMGIGRLFMGFADRCWKASDLLFLTGMIISLRLFTKCLRNFSDAHRRSLKNKNIFESPKNFTNPENSKNKNKINYQDGIATEHRSFTHGPWLKFAKNRLSPSGEVKPNHFCRSEYRLPWASKY